MQRDPEQLDNLREIEAALVDALRDAHPPNAALRLLSLLGEVRLRIQEIGEI